MTQELTVYRRSELEAISDGCLHRYRSIWIDLADDSSDLALFGQAFAQIKHCYLERLVAGQLTQDAEEAKAAFIEGAALSACPPRLLPELQQVWNFHAERFEFDPERFIAAEVHGTNDRVRWTPDLVQTCQGNGLEIVDDKSGWHPPLTEDELKGNFQARVYSRYARDRFPNFSRYYFTLYAIRFNKRVTVSYTPEELDSVDVEIAAAIATIEHAKATGEWPAIPGPSCRFCTLACPVADNQLVMPKRLTPEQWMKLGAWLLPAEKKIRELKKLMKEGCAVYGPCDIGGVVWDNRPVVSRIYPVDAVRDAMRKNGVDKDSAALGNDNFGLTLSQSSLAKMFKAYPKVQDDLIPFQQTKESYRFTAKKAGEEDEDA